jgi:hypothetical protein
MLIAIAAGIMLFFGGSSAGPFGELLSRYAEEAMKNTIVDEQRRDLALKQLSLLNDSIEELNEQQAKVLEQFNGLVKDYSSNPEDFNRLFSLSREQQQRQVQKIWEQRSVMLGHIRPDEWKVIIHSAKAALQKQ